MISYDFERNNNLSCSIFCHTFNTNLLIKVMLNNLVLTNLDLLIPTIGLPRYMKNAESMLSMHIYS